MYEYLTPPSDFIPSYEHVLESPLKWTALLALLTIFYIISSTVVV